ncbi:MAG: peptidoglycan editing factor PgeF [Gammaproteobacteria bacterium]|nr:peptidoglycan editing factor PgeF [Gammaproteobacteria bacterium]MDH5800743.1 peptidoglycan editing factor PgeF [Gammaproteobacteria bacterium]
MNDDNKFIMPQWGVPSWVRAAVTTRLGGVSSQPYDSFNLGDHVGDDPGTVALNRQRLLDEMQLPSVPVWLQQVHGIRVVDAAGVSKADAVQADAAFTRTPGVVCAVMTADCLPVLFSDREGTVVAAAHAGWRGLAQGVLEATVAAMGVVDISELCVWLGPGIGAKAFEVGEDVRNAFLAYDEQSVLAFADVGNKKFLADMDLLARQRLQSLGVTQISGGGYCTYSDAQRFYSYRRDKITGRMASLIWLDASSA